MKNIKKLIINLPRSMKRMVIFCIDFAACYLTFWIYYVIRIDSWGLLGHPEIYALIFSVALSTPIFIRFGLYRSTFRFLGSAALASIVDAFILYSVIFFLIFSVVGISGIPRSIGVVQPILFFFGIGLTRYLGRYWLGTGYRSRFKKNHVEKKALIYGAGTEGRQLAIALNGNKFIHVKAFIDDGGGLVGQTIDEVPVYNKKHLKSLISNLDITDVFLAIPGATRAKRNGIISALEGCGVRVQTLPSATGRAFPSHVAITDLHDLDIADLLGRDEVPPDDDLIKKNIQNKIVLITGAGGSIGSELCRQIFRCSPERLILVDNSEHNLYQIYEALKKVAYRDGMAHSIDGRLVPCLASVCDERQMTNIISKHKPYIIFHAAAYKHVPLVEQNIVEGIKNNVFGTLNCVKICAKFNVENFVLVSTDKAVRPTNVMGSSKRIAELILQAFEDRKHSEFMPTKFSMVRFGNVLGSSGSVIPLFARQIKSGGPLTLTHMEITRYFMSIPEAAQLVMQASSLAFGGDVFVLDMGESVKIADLAKKMIYLSGLLVKDEFNNNGDIEIKLTGLRPGEKLYEELLIGENPVNTQHPKIMKAHEDFIGWPELEKDLIDLEVSVNNNDLNQIRLLIKKLVPGYSGNDHNLQNSCT